MQTTTRLACEATNGSNFLLRPGQPWRFTVATAPTTASIGSVAYFSNGAAGSPVLAFYNGTNWLRVDTLAAISAS